MARLISKPSPDASAETVPGAPRPVSQLCSEVQKRRSAESATWTIPCELITPLFGGGPQAGYVDEVTPVSAKGIRGQLRFWWRLIRGPTLINETGLDPTELLLVRESEVFGSSETASPFDLKVTVTQHNGFRELDQQRPYEFDKFGTEMYALFPATQDSRRKIPKILREGLQFQMEISWPTHEQFSTRVKRESRKREEENERRTRGARRPVTTIPPLWADLDKVREELTAALWAWLNFGGIGSRTRRGVGAVSTRDPRYAYLSDRDRARYPLSGIILLTANARTGGGNPAMEAWRETLATYREFRQGCRGGKHRKDRLSTDRHTGRLRIENNVPVPAGETDWPEPDSIRLATGCSLKGQTVAVPGAGSYTQHDHSPLSTPERPLPRYPRAQLGLPINFQFADGPGQASDAAGISCSERDPDITQLVPQVIDSRGNKVPGERMASPVLTRPILVNGHWLPAIVILRCPWVGTIEAYLEFAGRSVFVPNAQIVDPSLCVPKRKDLRHTDTLAALEWFAGQRGFTSRVDGGQS